MRFIDLFAGLGGFHLALNSMGHNCVYASEIDTELRELYYKNFRIKPDGDIREVLVKDIPEHDILCAGFPCQPFSKAGYQDGLDYALGGDAFIYMLKIIAHHRPKYLLLENVPNLKTHDDGKTWAFMQQEIEDLGYTVDDFFLSPDDFGIPQIRKRMFIVACRDGLDHFKRPRPSRIVPDIRSILDDNPSDARGLSDQVLECIQVWQDFIDLYPKDKQLPSFPIWSMEFGATYRYQRTTPFASKYETLRYYKGNHGISLRQSTNKDELFEFLPSYARAKNDVFPNWKIRYISQNRQLYEENKDWIDEWLPKILKFPQSLQKFEWNCKGEPRDLSRYILQFRASGLRVKRPTTAPSLVAQSTTQVPIIAWEERYMSPRECARLQSMGQLAHLPESWSAIAKALGNAVNVEIIRLIGRNLIVDKNVENDREIPNESRAV